MPVKRSLLAVLPFLGVLACSSPMAGTPAAAPDPPPAAAAGQGPTDGCPLAAADLSTATALSWELRLTEADRPWRPWSR